MQQSFRLYTWHALNRAWLTRPSLPICEDGSIVSIIEIFENLLTNILKDFFIGDPGAFRLIEGPVTAVECKLFFRQYRLMIINFLDIKSLSIHINDEFLIGIDLIFFEGTHSDNYLNAIALAWHQFHFKINK